MKKIEKKYEVYVAKDGANFSTEDACVKYELQLEEKEKQKKKIEAAEKLRIENLDEQMPLSSDGLVNEDNTFRWYRLQNRNDFAILNEAYRFSLREPETYPEILCVETCGHEAYMDDAYSYDITTCKKITEEFWEKLGFKVNIDVSKRPYMTEGYKKV